MVEYKEKRDYLVGKLIDGAKVLNEFFNEAIKNKEINLGLLEKSLVKKYELTENQKSRFAWVMEKVSEAREIVSNLRDKFGINTYGDFRNRGGLFELVYEEKAPKEHFVARPYGFCIGFFLPERYFDNALGEAWIPIDIDMSDLGIDRDLSEKDLCFKINYRPIREIQLTPNERLLKGLFGLSPNEFKIISHEIKHVIDGLSSKCDILDEMSSYLFSNEFEKYSLEIDKLHMMKVKEKRLKDCIERFDEAKLLDVPEVFLSMELKLIDLVKKGIEKIKKFEFPSELIESLLERGLEKKVLSYIVSSIEYSKLEKRLDLISNYLDSCKK